MTEYTINELDKAIFYYLSINELDVPISISTIYNNLHTENICPELYNLENIKINKIRFTTICHTITEKYDNVYKLYENDSMYLMLSSKKDIEKIKYAVTDDFKNFINYEQLFKNILNENNCNNYEKLETIILDKFNEHDTMLHIICRNGYENLLNDILNTYCVDFDTNILNSLDETLMDVLPETKTGMDMMEILLYYEHGKQYLQLKIKNHDEKLLIEQEKIQIEKEKLLIEQEKIQIEKEKKQNIYILHDYQHKYEFMQYKYVLMQCFIYLYFLLDYLNFSENLTVKHTTLLITIILNFFN
jgi:CRISPR/Cas system CSM-associated protein Csm4 (group 5 of RAMP superfamily)